MTCRFLKVAARWAPPLVFVLSAVAQAAEPPGTGATFVAGLAPYQRPEGAPAIREFAADAAWRVRALTGIGAPVPASLGFLDHQGAWYTPYNHPGMPGYYDLRQWHQGGAGSGKPIR